MYSKVDVSKYMCNEDLQMFLEMKKRYKMPH